MGTISPDITRKIAAEFQKRGVSMLDAPLSGSPVTVQQGNASLMIGGDKAASSGSSRRFVRLGRKLPHPPEWEAAAMKLAVNALLMVEKAHRIWRGSSVG